MAVTTRKRAAPAAAVPEKPTKKAAPARRKPASKSSKAAAVEPEPKEQDNEEQEEEQEDSHDEESKATQDDSSDDEVFKIHTTKATTEPRIMPVTLPTMKYEDDDEDSDSDDAPEAESLSSAKAKILGAQDKEKSFLSKIQAEQKAKRVEREEKLKTQKEQAKKKTEAKTRVQDKEQVSEEAPQSTTTTKSGLPELLPMDILESVAQMEDSQEPSHAQGSSKKHMRPEDFALIELEAELKAAALKRKKDEKTQKNVGPVTVKVLDQSHLAKGQPIPDKITAFRNRHFYGSKIQRKDAVLNISQRNVGAALKFRRKPNPLY